MTLAWRASGSNQTNSTTAEATISPPYPTGMALGDLLICFIGMKPNVANGGSVATPPGWTAQGSFSGGGYGTTLAADTGNTNIYIFTKEYTGAESTADPVVFNLTDNNVSWAQIVRVNDNTNANITYGYSSIVTGEQTVGGNVNVTMGTDPGIASGDFLMLGICIPTDVNGTANFTSGALAVSGCTFTTNEVSEKASATANDIAGCTWIINCTAGTSASTPTFTATSGTTQTNIRGPLILQRYRSVSGNTYRKYNEDSAGVSDSVVVGLAPIDNANPTDSQAYSFGDVNSDDSGTTDTVALSRTIASTDPSVPTDSFVPERVISDTSGLIDSQIIDRQMVQEDPTWFTDIGFVIIDFSGVQSDIGAPTDDFVISRGLFVTTTDACGVSDSISIAIDYRSSYTDSSGTTDTTSSLLSLARIFIDDDGVTDTSSAVKAFPVLQVDDTDVVDAPIASLGSHLPADGAGLVDSVTIDRFNVYSDNSVPTDNAIVAKTITVTDDGGVSDSWGHVHGTISTDTSGLVDSSVVVNGKVFTDVSGLVDSRVIDRETVPTDTENCTDFITVSVGYGIDITEDSVPSDSSVVNATTNWTQVSTDNMVPVDFYTYDWGPGSVDTSGLVDVVVVAIGRNLSFTDSETPTDGITYGWGPGRVDTSGLVDTPTIDRSIVTTDASGNSDTSIVNPLRQVAGQDVTSVSDSAALSPSFVFTDVDGVTDSPIFTFLPAPTDITTITETQTWDRSHNYQDLLGATDNAVVSQGFGVSSTDGVTTSDPAVIGNGRGLLFTDDAGVGEYFPFLSYGPSFTDSAAPTDRIITEPGRIDTAGATDSVSFSISSSFVDVVVPTEAISVSTNGVLSAQDLAGLVDATTVDRSVVSSDTAGVVDSAVALKFVAVQPTDTAGVTDSFTVVRSFATEEPIVEIDSVIFDRRSSVTDTSGLIETNVIDRSLFQQELPSPSDSITRVVGYGREDSAGISDPAIIVISASTAYVDTESVTDSIAFSVILRATYIDDAGVTDSSIVLNGIERNVTVEGSLAPQDRILATLASPQRIAGMLGLQPDRVVQLAAQGRISVTISSWPRIVGLLEGQP